MPQIQHVEYICTWCGRKIVKRGDFGRPDPGNCPRRFQTKNGKSSPHVWRVNRKF